MRQPRRLYMNIEVAAQWEMRDYAADACSPTNVCKKIARQRVAQRPPLRLRLLRWPPCEGAPVYRT